MVSFAICSDPIGFTMKRSNMVSQITIAIIVSCIVLMFFIQNQRDYGNKIYKNEMKRERYLGSKNETSFLKKIVQDMYLHFNENDEEESISNIDFIENELKTCLEKWDDPNLETAVDEQWKGMVEYFQNNPNQDWDPWIDCRENPSNDRCTSQFKESELEGWRWSTFGNGTDREMLIIEPCNYVSNIAYYHSAIRICEYDGWGDKNISVDNIAYRRALKRGFTSLASGSAFMHGSNTILGGLFDNLLIAVIAYISHEQIANALGPEWTSSGLLSCIDSSNESATCQSSISLVEETTFFSSNYNVSEWFDRLENAKNTFQAKYELLFSVCTFVLLDTIYPSFISDSLISFLLDVLVSDGDKQFMNEVYLPTAKPLLRQIIQNKISFYDKWILHWTFTGTFMKIIYAFVWQEQTLEFYIIDILPPCLGPIFAPMLNWISTFLNGFHSRRLNSVANNLEKNRYEYVAKDCYYPGSKQCNDVSSHAFWHQQSALGK